MNTEISEMARSVVAKRDAGMTLEEVAKEFGVTRERIRQIEAKARSEEMPQEPVDQAIFLVQRADALVSFTRRLIYTIFAEKLWEGRYSSFGEFVEMGLGKSQGWASKQLAVYKHFVLEGGIPESNLEFDTERLYLASKSEGTAEEQLSRAKTLSRSELKAEKNEAQPHKGEFRSVCTVCWVPEETHP